MNNDIYFDFVDFCYKGMFHFVEPGQNLMVTGQVPNNQ